MNNSAGTKLSLIFPNLPYLQIVQHLKTEAGKATGDHRLATINFPVDYFGVSANSGYQLIRLDMVITGDTTLWWLILTIGYWNYATKGSGLNTIDPDMVTLVFYMLLELHL